MIDDSAFLSGAIMTHPLMKLSEEKRQRILDAGIDGFNRGYAPANTDDISAAAGISKGALFHYFGSKKQMFLFLLTYAAEIIGGEFNAYRFSNHDYLENIRELSRLSQSLTQKRGRLYGFLSAAYMSALKEFPEEVAKLRNPLDAVLKKIRSEADRSLFKPEIDPEEGMNIIDWVTEGYSRKIEKRFGKFTLKPDFSAYRTEIETIEIEFGNLISLLKTILYR